MKEESDIMKFTVIITYDDDYKGYVADVPELFGCMSQGKTLDEVLDNIKDAIKGWLIVEENEGRHIDLKNTSPKEIFLGEVSV